MTELFKKPVMPATMDVLWGEDFPLLAGCGPAPMLTVARPYAVGSKEESTLMNMLKACGFSADGVAIIQVEENVVLPWPTIRAIVAPHYALLLGVPPAQLGIAAQFPANAAAEFAGATFIWTSTLQHLTATEAARKSLWADVLKPLFQKG